jgi:hypothetical protein
MPDIEKIVEIISNSQGINGLFAGIVAVALSAIFFSNNRENPIKTIIITLAVIIIFYLFTIITLAYLDEGNVYSVKGTITDSCGKPITFTNVSILNEKNEPVNTIGSRKTTQNGTYSFDIEIFSHKDKVIIRVDSSCGGKGASDLTSPTIGTINFSTIGCCNKTQNFTLTGIVKKDYKLKQGVKVFLYKGVKPSPDNKLDSAYTNQDGKYTFSLPLPNNSVVTIKAINSECENESPFDNITLPNVFESPILLNFDLNDCSQETTSNNNSSNSNNNSTHTQEKIELKKSVLTLDQFYLDNTFIEIKEKTTMKTISIATQGIKISANVEDGKSYIYTIKRDSKVIANGEFLGGDNITVPR